MAPPPAEISWEVSDRRTFGVLPGREWFRSARTHATRLLGLVKAWVLLLVEVAEARLEAERERLRIRRQASALTQERSRRVQKLGEAALGGGKREIDTTRARVVEVDMQLQGLHDDARRAEQRLKRRLERAHREEGKTETAEAV